MAVSVNIGANAGGAVDAIRQIQAAIERAGQAGREFSKLDLSHPELAGMADDIRRLSQRFEELGRIGRGSTAAAYRRISGGSSDPLMWDFRLENAFPDQRERDRHRQQVLNYVTRGTRWQGGNLLSGEPGGATGGGGSPPPSAAGTGVGIGAGIAGAAAGGGNILGAIGAGIGFSLGLAGINTVKQVLGEALGKAGEEASNVEDIYRHTDQVQNYRDLRDAIMESTKAFGVNALEAARMTLSWQKITGNTDAAAATSAVRLGTGFARSFGMDPNASVQSLAQASNAGIDPRTFATLVGEAAAKGGRSPDETMQSLLHLAESSAKAFIDHLGTNLVQSSGFLAGLNATGLPGMRNGGSEQIMSTLTQGIRNPGAGVAGEAFMYSALARQGLTDPYLQLRAREGGLFEKLPSGATMFEALNAEAFRQYPGNSPHDQARRENAMENLLQGLNMRQWHAVEVSKPQDLSTTFKALSNAGINPENLNPSSLADVVRISNAPVGGLEQIRQDFLERSGQGALSAADQEALRGADAESLRNSLLKMAEKYGQSETEGSKTREATANLTDAMIKLGRDMLPAFNDLKDGLGTLGGQIGDLGSILTDVYKAGKGDPEASDRLWYGAKGMRAGGGEAPLSDAASKEREAQLMAFYTSPAGGGWSRNQAAGLTEAAMAESGGRARGPAGDNGLAQGLYQWHPDRVAAIETHFGKKLSDMGVLEQAAAKNWELSPEGPEAEAGRKLRATTSAYGAGYADTVYDQRPAYKEWRGMQRGFQAEGIANPGAFPTTVSIEPLDVIHRDTAGNILGMQSLPVTQVDQPTPWGPPRDGQPPKRPPPPPPPAIGSAAWWGVN